MINVLSVIDTLGPGGAETVFLNTCTALDPARFRNVCVIGGEGWLADALRARGIEPHLFASKGSFNHAYLRQLTGLARASKAHVIAAHLYGPAIYCSMAGIALRTPVVSVLHGQSDIGDGGRLSWLKKLSVRLGTTRMVFVSRRLEEALRGTLRLGERRCLVIPNGIDPAEFAADGTRPLRAELGLPPDRVLVGAVGNLRTPKAYDVWLRAARLLKDRSPRYAFAIAGQGSGELQQRLLALRQELGLENDVTFLGLRADVAAILRSLDVYALSSDTEGFSIACIEAMAAGAPVVSTRSGGPEEIIEDGRSGLLVPTRDPRALADAIDRVVTDAGFAAQLRSNALARVAEKFSLAQMVREYERVFAQTAKAP
jgi:glycosyltransferase involved in cell wall biosynthesis